MKRLLKLTTNSTRDEWTSMSVSEEVGGVSNNLANVEVVTSVDTITKDTSLEGASQTAGRNAACIRSNRVGKGNARWSCTALGRLMNMCRCQGCRLVFANDTRECDILMCLLVLPWDQLLKAKGHLRSRWYCQQC